MRYATVPKQCVQGKPKPAKSAHFCVVFSVKFSEYFELSSQT